MSIVNLHKSVQVSKQSMWVVLVWIVVKNHVNQFWLGATNSGQHCSYVVKSEVAILLRKLT